MYKLILPVASVFLLAACDSDEGVRVARNVEIRSESTSEAGSALKVISALQCPADQGVLTRIGTASVDGRTCTYSGPRGAEVRLHLVALDNRAPDDILREFQTDLVPVDADTRSPVVTAEVNERAEGDTTRIRMPGMSVDAEGERADIRLPGMRIEADGNKANIRIGNLVINADDSGSTIQAPDLQIEANDAGARVRVSTNDSTRATLIHAMSEPDANGWRVVGYEARGPAGGPMVVATFRTRDRDEEDIVEAVRELVKLNIGD